MREPEEDAGGEDRRPSAVRKEQGESEAAVGELLDDRGEDRHREEEGNKGASVLWFPFVRDEPLLVSAAAEHGGKRRRRSPDREERQPCVSKGTRPGVWPSQREHLTLGQADGNQEEDAQDESVLDECADRGRVLVGRV